MKKFITAKQLAEELLKNPDDLVCSATSNFEQGNSTIPLTSIRLHRYKGEVKSKGFRDAFDGGSYSSDVVVYEGQVDDKTTKGKQVFVKI